jgi:hypothetical protein
MQKSIIFQAVRQGRIIVRFQDSNGLQIQRACLIISSLPPVKDGKRMQCVRDMGIISIQNVLVVLRYQEESSSIVPRTREELTPFSSSPRPFGTVFTNMVLEMCDRDINFSKSLMEWKDRNVSCKFITAPF